MAWWNADQLQDGARPTPETGAVGSHGRRRNARHREQEAGVEAQTGDAQDQSKSGGRSKYVSSAGRRGCGRCEKRVSFAAGSQEAGDRHHRTSRYGFGP